MGFMNWARRKVGGARRWERRTTRRAYRYAKRSVRSYKGKYKSKIYN